MKARTIFVGREPDHSGGHCSQKAVYLLYRPSGYASNGQQGGSGSHDGCRWSSFYRFGAKIDKVVTGLWVYFVYIVGDKIGCNGVMGVFIAWASAID